MKTKVIVLIFCILPLLLIFTLFIPECSFAQEIEEDLEEIFAIFTEEEMVVSALKKPRAAVRSPAIMSVITAEQIKQMGFRTLTDILKIVPGIDIDSTGPGEILVYARGGIDSQKVKVMIDSHSISDYWNGRATWNFDDLVVENIKRVEVIRGPGSALHGQNAFLAVVNVITKDTDDIDGFQWTTGGGSFDTQNYNMLFGKEIEELKISGYFDYYDTQGHSEEVEQDYIGLLAEEAPPYLDIYGSKSPGRTHNKKEKTDLNLKLSYKNLEINGKYMKKRRDDYIGTIKALNDDTKFRDTYIFSELIYKLPITEKLNMNPKVYYDQHNLNYLVQLVPDNSGFAISLGPVEPISVDYPDGISGFFRLKNRVIGFDNQFDYEVFEGNELTFGFQYEWIHQHDIHYAANAHPITLEPLPEFTDFSDDYPFTKNATRQIWSLYLQDEWNITDDLDLTIGVRHDQFSRFGGTTNPRVGLIWRFMEDAYLKLLFATAFRTPSFQELFVLNNPFLLGNPKLDPEKVNTYEVALGYNFTKNLRINANYFFNRIRDRIDVVETTFPYTYENVGGVRIMGVETELRAGFGNDNYFYANYTFQDAEETSDRTRIPFIPVHKANFGLNVVPWKYVNANIDTFISGPRPREDGDTRHDLPSHTLVNLTLIGKKFMDNFEIRSSVFNLFDHDYEDPAPQGTVPNDFPQPGRSFVVELRYQF